MALDLSQCCELPSTELSSCDVSILTRHHIFLLFSPYCMPFLDTRHTAAFIWYHFADWDLRILSILLCFFLTHHKHPKIKFKVVKNKKIRAISSNSKWGFWKIKIWNLLQGRSRPLLELIREHISHPSAYKMEKINENGLLVSAGGHKLLQFRGSSVASFSLKLTSRTRGNKIWETTLSWAEFSLEIQPVVRQRWYRTPHLKERKKKAVPFFSQIFFKVFAPSKKKNSKKGGGGKEKALTSSIVTFILKRTSGLDIVLFVVMCVPLHSRRIELFIFSPLFSKSLL